MGDSELSWGFTAMAEQVCQGAFQTLALAARLGRRSGLPFAEKLKRQARMRRAETMLRLTAHWTSSEPAEWQSLPQQHANIFGERGRPVFPGTFLCG